MEARNPAEPRPRGRRALERFRPEVHPRARALSRDVRRGSCAPRDTAIAWNSKITQTKIFATPRPGSSEPAAPPPPAPPTPFFFSRPTPAQPAPHRLKNLPGWCEGAATLFSVGRCLPAPLEVDQGTGCSPARACPRCNSNFTSKLEVDLRTSPKAVFLSEISASTACCACHLEDTASACLFVHPPPPVRCHPPRMRSARRSPAPAPAPSSGRRSPCGPRPRSDPKRRRSPEVTVATRFDARFSGP